MRNRTSDFMALATIFGGATLGLGAMSLAARSAEVPLADEASVEVRVSPARVFVRLGSDAPSIYYLRTRSDVLRLRHDVERAQERAADLVREQLDIRERMDRLGESADGPHSEAGRRMFDRKEAMNDELADLQREIDRLATDTQADHAEVSERLQEAGTTILDDHLKERVRYSRGLIGIQDRDYTREFEAETSRIVEELEAELERASDAMGDRSQDLQRFEWHVEGLESLDDLVSISGEDLTIDVRRDDEDRRRRRRTRRPNR